MSSLQQNWRRRKNRFCLEVREVGDSEGVGGRGRFGSNNGLNCMHI
jgi:hypothetical protein